MGGTNLCHALCGRLNIGCRIRKRFKNPDESIRYILKSCKNGSEPEENKSGGIFQNKKGIPPPQKKSDKRWKIGEIDHDEAKSYKYLGVIIRNNATFTEHVSVVKDKAIIAYYALIAKNREWQRFSPKTFLHIFDHTILPILNYAADVWGGNEWPDLERIHLMACKLILGVNQATPSNAIYTEPGRYPLETHRKISMIKYIKRFENLPDEKLAKKLLNS